mmetsp:Transcript_17125/g.24863  ORF Transcript_17125/g.24863 Transcript_17125/m.24863 type:complete len:1786 (+) Transcript_17125:45-5402(+)
MGSIDLRPCEETEDRLLILGNPEILGNDNAVTTTKYTKANFFPKTLKDQFSRLGNAYFLVVSIIIGIGAYTSAFQTSQSPIFTFLPLVGLISISIFEEWRADRARGMRDKQVNSYPCILLKRGEDIDASGGERVRDETVFNGEDLEVQLDTEHQEQKESTLDGEDATSVSIEVDSDKSNTMKLAFERVGRNKIYGGDIVLVKSREMIPADMIILATSNEGGSAYIETSSIDGETNLKLKSSPNWPGNIAPGSSVRGQSFNVNEAESLEQAAKRVARFTILGHPDGKNAMDNPNNSLEDDNDEVESFNAEISPRSSKMSRQFSLQGVFASSKKSLAYKGLLTSVLSSQSLADDGTTYVASLLSEPPNANVNTYSGKLTLPPSKPGDPSPVVPLSSDNFLLRGALLRNTEWVIGLACFTGDDTKLVKNSFETPSKKSDLDRLVNNTVLVFLVIMILGTIVMASFAVSYQEHHSESAWIFGINDNKSEPWPYLPGLPPPDWRTESQNFIQYFFTFVTLLNGFVPISVYVTIEMVSFCMMAFIDKDIDMYHEKTDTPASARTNIVTDLGRVSYIFSDKTGTLTRNVMRFKRCSVDGIAFGAPIVKKSPKATDQQEGPGISGDATKAFHPLKQLLVGAVSMPSPEDLTGNKTKQSTENTLTFNAEMFLRVMSLCHTVVVEKEFDPSHIDRDETKEKKKKKTPFSKISNLFSKKNKKIERDELSTVASSDASENIGSEASSVSEDNGDEKDVGMGPDGAPLGYVYEAESPDEGALVSGASATYGFQFVGRNSSGMLLKCTSPSLLKDQETVNMLRDGKLTPKDLASKTAFPIASDEIMQATDSSSSLEGDMNGTATRYERWEVLAINKFDSDRKRMSVLLRSPPELGSLPILFCKGADSSMLDATICDDGSYLFKNEITDALGTISENEEDWQISAMLGIQAHLGDFASEGLRTLVLGVRILTEGECESWLKQYNAASSSIKNRSKLLTDAALAIERSLHIVGATAIEDKLQKGVPETIHSLEEAGIKLWVLTGDKRETAIEIGYSTNVLTPKMHVTEIAEGPEEGVKILIASEFMKLVKQGRLEEYQKSSLVEKKPSCFTKYCSEPLGRFCRRISRSTRLFYYSKVKPFCRKYIFCCFFETSESVYDENAIQGVKDEERAEEQKIDPVVRRRNVRERAERIIHEYLGLPEAMASGAQSTVSPKSPSEQKEVSLSNIITSGTGQVRNVFKRASTARSSMQSLRKSSSMGMSPSDLRSLALSSMTENDIKMRESALHTLDERDEEEDDEFHDDMTTPLIKSDFLSTESMKITSSFDASARTMLEKTFATDQTTRHGKLNKHTKKPVKQSTGMTLTSEPSDVTDDFQDESLRQGDTSKSQMALVIEGAALGHLLGDDVLEEMIFAVASSCDSVIACRVSPKQKALLVRLVRNYVNPTPVTLAIGDGANDVGMIQEAHIGVGISGLEGQQAVNSSDFAIAQFRFLRDLLLIHGRWNFIRMSKVVLYSFYKNAVATALLYVFQPFCAFSGTILIDQMLTAGFNFFLFFPIVLLGIFDRDLDKDYVRRNPEVYSSSRRNEHMTGRLASRWLFAFIFHTLTIFFLNYAPLSAAGMQTSAFDGLMSGANKNRPGDGEGGGYYVFGTLICNSLILTMTYKVIYETKSIIIGYPPACTCKKDVGEGFINRLAYTWVGVTYGSVAPYIIFVFVYQLFGRLFGPKIKIFFGYVNVADHALGKMSITWMLFLMVPIAGTLIEVAMKVFGNLFFPTQGQIHSEIASNEIARAKKLAKEATVEET